MTDLQFLEHLEAKLERHKSSLITLAHWERARLAQLRNMVAIGSSRFIQPKVTVEAQIKEAYERAAARVTNKLAGKTSATVIHDDVIDCTAIIDFGKIRFIP